MPTIIKVGFLEKYISMMEGNFSEFLQFAIFEV